MPSVIDGDDDFDSGKAFAQNQTWQNVSDQRAQGEPYTNDTGKAIEVKVTSVSTTSARTFTIDGNEIQRFQTTNASIMTLGGTVPPGSTYLAFNVGSTATWWELR